MTELNQPTPVTSKDPKLLPEAKGIPLQRPAQSQHNTKQICVAARPLFSTPQISPPGGFPFLLPSRFHRALPRHVQARYQSFRYTVGRSNTTSFRTCAISSNGGHLALRAEGQFERLETKSKLVKRLGEHTSGPDYGLGLLHELNLTLIEFGHGR